MRSELQPIIITALQKCKSTYVIVFNDTPEQKALAIDYLRKMVDNPDLDFTLQDFRSMIKKVGEYV